jgi:predicted dehydrogenase
MTAVGVALVGAGPWGLTLGRAAARLPEVDLRWICELDPERRALAGAIAPRARLTDALDEVLTDPAVAAALVAVDSPRHHPVGVRVLRADRHLLVEKPMALTVADATELSALADARKRVLSVGHLLLHHPAVRRARQLIEDGVLGESLWLETTRLAPGTARSGGSAWWTLAPHDVSLALHLFGAVPARVTAVGGAKRQPGAIPVRFTAVGVIQPGRETAPVHRTAAGRTNAEPDRLEQNQESRLDQPDTVAWVTLHFDDGRLAHLHVARLAVEKRRCFSVVGTRRALTFDELDPGRGLRIHEPARSGVAAHAEIIPVDTADALSAQCLHFIASVARGDPSAGNGAHALAVVRVLEAGTRSMRAGGAPVEVA